MAGLEETELRSPHGPPHRNKDLAVTTFLDPNSHIKRKRKELTFGSNELMVTQVFVFSFFSLFLNMSVTLKILT